MAKVRTYISPAQGAAYRNSASVQAMLLEKAEAIKARADSMGSGRYEADVQPGRTRARATVSTTDALSMASNQKHNTLLKSI